jgi:transcriptional regulator with XRE-family HTH domain
MFTFVIRKILHMKERILEFLKRENKSSVQFAEEIGVQPSGISHILSGRNRPSLDFILKMLDKYSFLSVEWLLFGRGPMYGETKEPTLFDSNIRPDSHNNEDNENVNVKKVAEFTSAKVKPDEITKYTQDEQISKIKKIIWFYDDNSFEEFSPLID